MQKTHQSAAKRFMRTGKGKIFKRPTGQDHANAQEPGKVTTSKRKMRQLKGLHAKNIRSII